jgi:hypothetical protein
MITKKYFLYWLLLCSQFCYGQVKDSVLFGKIRVQSSSSICLQGESLRIELMVGYPTNDSIVLTCRLINRGNKVMGIDGRYDEYHDKETQKVYFTSSFLDYSSLFHVYYCGIESIAPGEHYEFTNKVFAPQYKTIKIEFIYIPNIPFLVEKKVVHHSFNKKVCYSLKEDWSFLETFMLEFEKNSQEIDILLPIKGCLCEPTLTPTKD